MRGKAGSPDREGTQLSPGKALWVVCSSASWNMFGLYYAATREEAATRYLQGVVPDAEASERREYEEEIAGTVYITTRQINLARQGIIEV